MRDKQNTVPHAITTVLNIGDTNAERVQPAVWIEWCVKHWRYTGQTRAIIHASGEFEAAAKLAEAAAVVAKEPVAIQLRYLQTLTEIAFRWFIAASKSAKLLSMMVSCSGVGSA
jgi:hypothetical protein